MDNFREWLSDNLRYFMLGGAILIIVAGLFFGIRACVGSKKGNSEQEQVTAQDDQGNVPSSSAKDGETDDGKKDANPMQKASEEVTALITSYYKALGEKDVESLKAMEVNFAPADEAKIINAKDYIEGYEVGDVYTKQGLEEDTYVVYACHSYIFKDIDTPAPILSQLYVITDTNGSLKIDGGWMDNEEITAYTDELDKDEDVKKLTAEVKAANDKAQQDDPALAEFLAGLGDDASSSSAIEADNGTMLTVKEDCNVRAAANSDADVIGGYPAGTQIEKLGSEGDWVQVEYEGQTGYINKSLLE